MKPNREILFSLTKKDFIRQTFRAGGKGGQHQNKTDSAVRITHKESGAVGVSRDERSQHANQKIAFGRLMDSKEFKIWHRIKSAEMFGTRKTKAQIIQEVEESMVPKNLKVECLGGL